MIDPQLKSELRNLVNLSLEGQISDEQYRNLNKILESSNSAFNYYLELIELHQALASSNWEIEYNAFFSARKMMGMLEEFADYEKTAPTLKIEELESEKVPVEMLKIEKPPRVINKFSLYSALISAAAALIFVLLYVKFAPTAASTVATISDSINAQWSPSEHPTNVGDRMWNNEGTRWLQKGAVKIAFDYGAEVIIEGPAEFELLTAKQMLLHSGRVYAEVPKHATGFTVETPCSTVIDLGTNFGVKVDFDGSTDVHMFKGRVSLIPGVDGQKGQSLDVLAGEAVRVMRDDLNIQAIPLRQKDFVTYIPSPYEQYAKSLKPFHYLRFDQNASDLLLNLTNPEGLKSRFGGGVSWVEGPDLGEGKTSPAVQFSGAGTDGVSVELPLMNEKNGFTYSLWVKPEVIRESCIVAMQGANAGTFREIGLDQQGHFIQCARRSDGGVRGIINPTVSKTVAQPGQWYHVVVTAKWGINKKLYINGSYVNLSETKVGTYTSNEDFRRCYLGQTPNSPFYKNAAGFKGAVCEFLIFDRVLSDNEVLRLYQSSGGTAGK